MGRFTALLFLVFGFGLMSSVSMAKPTSHADAPIAAVPKAAPTDSPAASPPASAASQDAKTPSSAAGSQDAKTPSSASSPTAQVPAHSPRAEGPGPALPPISAAAATATLEKIVTLFAAALVGGTVFLL